MTTRPIVCIFGPTCSGKTTVGIEVALWLGGEIVSCDSMQVYRGMDIGTAKPTAEELARVPHHLVDILDIAERYDANKFVSRAEGAIHSLHERDIVPVLVGGTGMYARALVYGMRLEAADPAVFATILQEFEEPGGRERLRAEVSAVDVNRAEELDRNPRRLMRAVEVLRLTGELPALPRKGSMSPRPGFAQFILLPEPAHHRRCIRQRTEAMIAEGWVEETRKLLELGLLKTPTARQALGYRDIGDHLRGDLYASVEELTEKLFHRTVHYARRQRTWFRHQHPGAQVIAVDGETRIDDVVLRVVSACTR